MNFHMPSSWYDPPEYRFQKQAEEIDSKGLWGLYEADPKTGKILRDWEIPDLVGTREEVEAQYNAIMQDYEDDEDYKNSWVAMELTFDTCCTMAESEYEDALEAHYDYKYHAEKESQPCDYDDYY
jgi:hypothetical protein